MKVLQVNCVYKKGSTGKITYDLHQGLLKAGIDSVVCYGRGNVVKEENVYKTCGELYSKFNNLLSRFTGIMYGGCFFSTNRLISIIRKEKPDIVHLQCINGYFVNIYRLITWLKKNKIRTVLTLHAEFMYTANCGYALECDNWKTGCGKCPRCREATGSLVFDRTAESWKRMEKAFDGFDTLKVVAVSPWLQERAFQSPMLADKKHYVVFNGLDNSVFKPLNTDALRKKLGLVNKKTIFHATAFFSDNRDYIKGGWYICELAKKMPEVRFIVAGPYCSNIEVPENVLLLGMVKDQDVLAQYYSLAEVTVLTSKKETFSMVVAESLCCGTPVVGFKAGGPERIAIKEYSRFCDYGDLDGITEELKAVLKTVKDSENCSKLAKERYSIGTSLQHYDEIYRSFT